MTAHLLNRHKKARQKTEQKNGMAHKMKKITAPGHPKRKPVREIPHSGSSKPKQNMHTQGTIDPKLDTSQIWLMREASDTPDSYEMDAEMQADQGLPIIALNTEARAYNMHKNKMDKWKTQKNINELKNRNAEKPITSHSQIRGRKQKGNQIKKIIQHEMLTKSPGKIKRHSKTRANGKIRISKKIEKLENTIYAAKHTPKKPNKTAIERLHQQIKRWKAR